VTRRALVLVLAAASVAEAQPPEALGPITIATERATVTLGFGMQLRTTLTDDEATLDLHRARPALWARFLDERVRFRFHADLAPRALELLDLFIEGDATEGLTIRLGIEKIPFTLHWDQGYLDLPFVDWGPTTRWFAGRQLGLSIRGDRGGWQWVVGLYQGQTLRAANGQRFPTAYGESAENHLDLRAPAPLSRPHPELIGRVSHRSGPAALALSLAWDLDPTYAHDETLRMALDGHLHWAALDLWAGAFLATAETGLGQSMVSHGGSSLELELRPHRRLGLALRHSAIVRSDRLRWDARRRADEQIATADDPAQMRERYAEVGGIRAEHESTFAVNVMLVGADLKLQADASWLREASTRPKDEWRVRIQANVGF